MSTDPATLFDTLRSDAGRASLVPPGELRGIGTRRLRVRRAAGVVAAVALVAGTVVGAEAWLRPAGRHPAPAVSPAVTASPAPTPSASADPPPGAQGDGCPAASVGDVPDAAFVQPSDDGTAADGGFACTASEIPPGMEVLPGPCASNPHPSDGQILRRRSLPLIAAQPGTGGPPPTMYAETITGYRSGGAARYLDEVRSAVQRCPSVRRGGVTHHTTVAGTGFAGDDSLLIADRYPGPTLDGSGTAQVTMLIAVIRVGDTVVVVHDVGWEGQPTGRRTWNLLVAASVTRLRAWLG